MRVLAIVQTWNERDPIRGFIVRWMEKLSEKVDELTVLALEQRHLTTNPKILVFSLGKERLPRFGRRWHYLVRWHRVMKFILHRHPDVIFTHMSPIFSVLAAPYAKLAGIPIVTWYAHPSLTLTLKLAHHFSNRMVTSLPTAYPYRHDKLKVIGQGIDTELFAPDGTEPENPPMILCVGRLSPVKNHLTLLKASALLRERWGKPFEVMIVGSPAIRKDDPYLKSLSETVRTLRLQDTVRFQEAVSMRELPKWYRRCTVHVNMTPTGFGDKVAWEAMASGRVCVAANEGFRETMGRYAHNLLYEHGNPESLAERLLWVLSLDEKEYSTIGTYLREQVVRLHSLERLGEKLAGILASL